MTTATRIVVQTTAHAIKRLNTNIKEGRTWARTADERALETCLAVCRAQGLQPLLIRDIDGSVAVKFTQEG